MTRKELINLKDAVLRRESLFYDLRESFKELESVTTDKREKALLSKAYETIAEIKEFY